MELLAQHSGLWLLGLAVALAATGLVAGVMAGLLGVGGGIVIVPVLYHLFTLLGIDESVRMHVTVGTSLATIIPTSIMSSRAHRRKGSLNMDLIRSLMPGVVVGVALGSVASRFLDGSVLTAVFACVALLVALNMAFKRDGFAVADGLPVEPLLDRWLVTGQQLKRTLASGRKAGAAPAQAHAAVVERLVQAGCRIIGKTRMHELAYGMTGVNAATGTPVNPRWPDRIPGGSSSGSAVAVAAMLSASAASCAAWRRMASCASCASCFCLASCSALAFAK